MPFTFSHAAAVVPLRKRGLVFSALVVGSMAPDFEYFLRLQRTATISHTLPGLFTFCLPAGLVALGLFHFLLKRPLLSLLPASHQQRLLPVTHDFPLLPARRLGLILASLALGTLTHLAWDSFTHHYGWIVQHMPLLRGVLLRTPYGTLLVYKALQHGSTLVGLGLLCYWYIRWYRQTPAMSLPSPPWPATARLGIVGLMALGAGLVAMAFGLRAAPAGMLRYALRARSLSVGSIWLRMFVGYAVVPAMAAVMLELAVYSTGWHLRERRKRESAT